MRVLIKTLSITLLMLSTNVSFAEGTFLQDRQGVKYRPNETVPYTGTYVFYQKNGLETLFFDRGQLLEETSYKNGLREQTSTTWYEKDLDAWWFQSGQKSSVSTWAKGKQTGVFKSWYEDGSRREASNWKEGKRHGEGRRWFSNGQLESITNHKLGVPDGMAVFWGVNGQQTTKLIYQEGVLVERDGQAVEKLESGESK
jgi:antitoxin component YwqK of YwqJK toxin-antitoxin module